MSELEIDITYVIPFCLIAGFIVVGIAWLCEIANRPRSTPKLPAPQPPPPPEKPIFSIDQVVEGQREFNFVDQSYPEQFQPKLREAVVLTIASSLCEDYPKLIHALILSGQPVKETIDFLSQRIVGELKPNFTVSKLIAATQKWIGPIMSQETPSDIVKHLQQIQLQLQRLPSQMPDPGAIVRSAAIAHATDSTLTGALFGGSLSGAYFGQKLRGKS